MAVVGFNIGATISLGDMSLAIDYLADKEAFEPDLQDIKQKISGKEIEVCNRGEARTIDGIPPVNSAEGLKFIEEEDPFEDEESSLFDIEEGIDIDNSDQYDTISDIDEKVENKEEDRSKNQEDTEFGLSELKDCSSDEQKENRPRALGKINTNFMEPEESDETEDDMEFDISELGDCNIEESELTEVAKAIGRSAETKNSDESDDDMQFDLSEMGDYGSKDQEEIVQKTNISLVESEDTKDAEDDLEIDISELGDYEDENETEVSKETTTNCEEYKGPAKPEDDMEFDISGLDDYEDAEEAESNTPKKTNENHISSKDIQESEDDIEIDMSELGDYEDETEEIEQPTVSNVSITTDNININKNVSNNQKGTKTISKDLINKEIELKKKLEQINKEKEEAKKQELQLLKEKELKRKLENLNREKEEAKKRELELLEQQVREAEQEMELAKAKNEALARKQTEIKTSVRVSTTNRPRQEIKKPVLRNEQSAIKKAAQQKAPTPAPEPEQRLISNIDRYSSMDIEALYLELRKFMQKKGVAKTIVDKKLLEGEFGSQNIKKLILKSYLISIGKGVTIGR